ncbi:MAG TPA: hypothetical protein G4O07_00185 [Dehalococcoidia bacterium]|nr:hypothetical protein [Dehalococcoidia bacterium]
MSRETENRQRGITGLETAIVLIAFVMVASVFAYVVLSAGLYSSQKAKEAIHQGLEETRGSVELRGSVLARMELDLLSDTYFATEVILCVATVSGGEAVDLTDTSGGDNKVTISYHDEYQQYPSLDWTLTKVVSTGVDNLLDSNEIFQITVDLSAVNNGAADDSQKVQAYTNINLELRPPNGSVLQVERTFPPKVSQIVNLY